MIELVTEQCVVRRIYEKRKQRTEIQTVDGTISYDGAKDAEPYVKAALGFHKLKLEANGSPEELNFVPVFAPPFLVYATPAEIQKKLAGVLGGAEFEEARAEIAKEARTAETELKLLERQEVERQASVEKLAPLVANMQAAQKKVEEGEALLSSTKLLLEKAQTALIPIPSSSECNVPSKDAAAAAARGVRSIQLIDLCGEAMRSIPKLVVKPPSIGNLPTLLTQLKLAQRGLALQTEHADLMSQQSTITTETVEATKELARIQSQIAVCPECKRPL